jgi:FKBP-type peptidyl-prolyl cis-trans isomerase
MRLAVTVLSLGVALIGCSESTTEPDEVVFQVIEETEFASTLGINLAAMTRLQSGVYIQDLAEGDPYGLEVVIGRVVVLEIQGWLADGVQWMNKVETLFLGATPSIVGLEDAVLQMLPGGERLAVIPPDRAYGDLPQLGPSGNVVVPAGSIVVLRIRVQSVTEVDAG